MERCTFINGKVGSEKIEGQQKISSVKTEHTCVSLPSFLHGNLSVNNTTDNLLKLGGVEVLWKEMLVVCLLETTDVLLVPLASELVCGRGRPRRLLPPSHRASEDSRAWWRRRSCLSCYWPASVPGLYLLSPAWAVGLLTGEDRRASGICKRHNLLSSYKFSIMEPTPIFISSFAIAITTA